MTCPATLAMRALADRLLTLPGITLATGASALDVDGETLPLATLLPSSDRSDTEMLRQPWGSYRREVLLEIFISADDPVFDETLDDWLFQVRQCLAVPPGSELLNGNVTWETAMQDVLFTAVPNQRLASIQIPITLTYLNTYTV